MSMKHTHFFGSLLIFVSFLLFAGLGCTGCSESKLSFAAKSDRSTDIAINLALGPALTSTLKAFVGDSASLLSADTIRESLAESDVSNLTVSNPTPDSLRAQGTIPAPEQQRHVTEGTMMTVASLVACTDTTLSIRLSPDTLKLVKAALPQKTQLYLDLFMAPVFTGEALSKEDYSALLGAVYGKDIAQELSNATISLSLSCPDKKRIVRATNGAKGTASRADFSIPLLDVLTLQTPCSFTISW